MENNNNNNNKGLATREVGPNQISMMRFSNSKGRDIAEAALFDTKIMHLNGEVEPIKQSLRYIFALIGLRAENLPSELQKAVLLEFVQTELKHYTPEELKLAFRMAVAGELDIDVTHYQNFNALYLSAVLNAYQQKRGQTLIEYQRQQKQLEPKKEPTEQELKDSFWQYVNTCLVEPFESYAKGGPQVPILFVEHMFEVLTVQLGVLSLTTGQKTAIFERAKVYTKHEVEAQSKTSLQKFRELKTMRQLLEQNQEANPEFEDRVKRNAKKMAIEEFFTNMKNNQFNFRAQVEAIKQNQYE